MPGETAMQQTITVLTLAGPGHFEVAGTRLLRGRTFEATDRPDSEPVAVVDETMARRIAPGGNVVGLVVRQGLVPVGVGLVLGLAAAFAAPATLLRCCSVSRPATLFHSSA